MLVLQDLAEKHAKETHEDVLKRTESKIESASKQDAPQTEAGGTDELSSSQGNNQRRSDHSRFATTGRDALVRMETKRRAALAITRAKQLSILLVSDLSLNFSFDKYFHLYLFLILTHTHHH